MFHSMTNFYKGGNMTLNQYLHGTYGAFSPSIGAVPVKSGTVAAYVGTAPVNLVRGYADKGVVNEPVKISNLSDAQNTLGYSDDWNTFTLCEADVYKRQVHDIITHARLTEKHEKILKQQAADAKEVVL